jgi:hypothetical protein
VCRSEFYLGKTFVPFLLKYCDLFPPVRCVPIRVLPR